MFALNIVVLQQSPGSSSTLSIPKACKKGEEGKGGGGAMRRFEGKPEV